MIDDSVGGAARLESVNISAGGIFFRSNIPFDSGTTLLIRFALPTVEEPVVSTCKVIHNLETIPGRQYFVGVTFEKLDGISFARLNQLLSDHYE